MGTTRGACGVIPPQSQQQAECDPEKHRSTCSRRNRHPDPRHAEHDYDDHRDHENDVTGTDHQYTAAQTDRHGVAEPTEQVALRYNSIEAPSAPSNFECGRSFDSVPTLPPETTGIAILSSTVSRFMRIPIAPRAIPGISQFTSMTKTSATDTAVHTASDHWLARVRPSSRPRAAACTTKSNKTSHSQRSLRPASRDKEPPTERPRRMPIEDCSERRH